jgi:phosphohistidine swiveling domain-containing protein
MVAKKIRNPHKSASKAVRINGLTAYIREPEKENAGEKCIYTNGRGFICDSPDIQTAEMVALSQEAVRSKDTVNHYVLSWREGEQPSVEQIERAVTIFTAELGLTDHQVIYGLHADTDNAHLHLAINRVHPDTLQCVEINKGFDLEVAHRAIARIEHEQGWEKEANARYNVLEDGTLEKRLIDENEPKKPDQPRVEMEERTGEKSAVRIAIEYGAPIIKQAQTWEQMHRKLAEVGMIYQRTGSGATITVGEVTVKASDADRNASLSKLVKRLGPYEPPPMKQQVAERKPEPMRPDMPGWTEYNVNRKTDDKNRTQNKSALDTRHEQERNALAMKQKLEREDVLGKTGKWKGQGVALNAMRSVMGEQHAEQRDKLKEQQKNEREQQRQRPYPDYRISTERRAALSVAWENEQRRRERYRANRRVIKSAGRITARIVPRPLGEVIRLAAEVLTTIAQVNDWRQARAYRQQVEQIKARFTQASNTAAPVKEQKKPVGRSR